ncbi:Putative ribonuclease H protein At1g65750 [Linum perenne]
MDKKLAGWKIKSLSTAGRVTMATSVLNSLPTYVMQTTLLPVEVCNTIDKKIRDFIWGSSNGERKMHLVNWETVCSPKRQGGLGLRSARELNNAYLMKLVWGLIKKPSELWADLLISKYMKRTSAGLIPRKSTRRSSCWKGISDNWELFRGGLRWSIRNGRKTNFWRERWLDSGVIIGEQINPPAGHEHGAVADYCDVKGDWDIRKLQHILTPPLLKAVVGMTPPLAELGNDSPVWGFEPDGNYTVRTGYRLAKDIIEDGGDEIWRIAWKWEGPQRVRQFMWTALHGRLLTNAERVRRHLTGTGECSLCNSASETDEHLLRSCHFARQVWIKLFNTSASNQFFTIPMGVWWKTNIADSERSLTFGYTCWILWKSRNEKVFEGRNCSVDSVVARVRFWVSTWNSATSEINSLKCGVASQARTIQVSWEAAPRPKSTLNTDGSVRRDSGDSAAGGVIRDPNGRVLDVFAANLGSCSISRAELTAVVIGMERAWDAGIRDLEVQTDSTCVLKLLADEGNREHQHAAIVRKFKHLTERNWRVNIKHIYREANHLADALANKGHTLDLGTHSVNRSEGSVLYWSSYDVAGGAEPRRVLM